MAVIRLLNPLLALFKELMAPCEGTGRALALASATLLMLAVAETKDCLFALADLVALPYLTDLTALVNSVLLTTLAVEIGVGVLANLLAVADLAEFGVWIVAPALRTLGDWMLLRDLAALVVMPAVGVLVALAGLIALDVWLELPNLAIYEA
jgi:hypothetical protein